MHRILCLIFIGLLFLMSVASAEEKLFEEQNGVIYYYGDRNFPLWSMGHRVGAVADISSAYIADVTGKWRLIGFLSFPVVLRKNDSLELAIPLEEELRECFFWQKVKTGDFYFYKDGRVGNKVEGKAFTRELSIYRLLMEAAENNMELASG